jgi:helicase required for RNAi-mediated heterochromatin assembly 1
MNPAQVLNLHPILLRHSSFDPWVKVKEGLPPELMEATGLDSSQLEGLQRMLTKELAIIQGPPGTGKTYTSIAALKTLLNSNQTAAPIVIAAQTNHALDQLLAHIDQQTNVKFIRLGGRSRNPTVAANTVYRLRQESTANTWNVQSSLCERQRQQNREQLDQTLQECFPPALLQLQVLRQHRILSSRQCKSLVSRAPVERPNKALQIWLGNMLVKAPCPRYSKLSGLKPEHEDVADDTKGNVEEEDAKDRLTGPLTVIERYWTGLILPVHSNGSKPSPQSILAAADDLYQIPEQDRGYVYRYLQAELIRRTTARCRALLAQSSEIAKRSKFYRWLTDVEIVRKAGVRVIGCTTTGLTKYRGFISALKPSVMLIEEAAETREANITSALFPSLQQLILVGDHVQLTPHADVPGLGDAPFNLKVSLFERLIRIGIPYTMLTVQRRMVPEIRQILGGFYPGLSDHPIVCDPAARPPIQGMKHMSFFFTHNWAEGRDRDFSRFNQMECGMVVGLFKHLVRNGLPVAHITVLTYYNGQRKRLLGALRRDAFLGALVDSELDPFKVHTVDGYQGEENEVIILSLVRSPSVGNRPEVGFVADQNRAVVAMSRARRGFYVFGNYMNLTRASPDSCRVWQKPTKVLIEQGRLGDGLPMLCERHGNQVMIASPKDWDGIDGGCREVCGGRLPCGHLCSRRCHP